MFVVTSSSPLWRLINFCVGFPTLCQGPRNLFLYIFICPRERSACHVVWRSVSREDWIPIGVSHSGLHSGHFCLSCWVLENLYEISFLFPGDFCFQGEDKSFSIFTGSLRAFTFQFCCESFTVKLSRKAIKFVYLFCVLSLIIWGVCFVIFSGVYNMRFFHASQHAETRLVLSAGCTGAFTLSQANIYRLGPSVRVVSDWKESLYSRKPTFFSLSIFVRVALQRVSECRNVSHECLKVSQTERNYCLSWTVKSVIYVNKLSFQLVGLLLLLLAQEHK